MNLSNSIYIEKFIAMFDHVIPDGGNQLTAYNEAVLNEQNAIVVTPKTDEDIISIVEFCQYNDLKLSVYSTGHDFEGRSLAGDIVIKMSNFNNVYLDQNTHLLSVGGGTRVYNINQTLKTHQRAISTGTNQDVGITGLTLGGGAAYTSRKHGLTCDALHEVKLITFAGEKLIVNQETEPEFFDLLKGGGGGYFGIVTELIFKTYPCYNVTLFNARWPFNGDCQLLEHLERLLIDAPNRVSMRIGANITGTEKVTSITLSGQVLDDENFDINAYFGDCLNNSKWTTKKCHYYEAMEGALHQTSGGAFKIKSRFAFKPIGLKGFERIMKFLQSWPTTKNIDGAGFGLFAWGGQVKQNKSVLSCSPGRNAEYLASFDTSWVKDEEGKVSHEQWLWLHELDVIAQPFLSSASYINFPDSDDGIFQQRHFRYIRSTHNSFRARFDPYAISFQQSKVFTI